MDRVNCLVSAGSSSPADQRARLDA